MAIIIDGRYVDIAKKIWGKEHKIFPSFCHANLQKQVCSHPDITLTQIDDIFICCPESYEYYKKILGNKVFSGQTQLFSHYPSDIAYNVLVYKNIAMGKKENIDPVVLSELKKRNIELINISQGYAKCSCCVCDEGIITADEGIFKTLKQAGINALKVTQGYVELRGYDYGFIGGASGIIDGKLTFFGDVSAHPDFLNIQAFCNFDYVKDVPLTDVGTIFCI